MTEDIHSPDETETRPNDHQQAVEACQHALDALDKIPIQKRCTVRGGDQGTGD